MRHNYKQRKAGTRGAGASGAIAISVILFLCSSCLPVADNRTLTEDGLQPPVLLDIEAVSENKTVIYFDKACSVVEETVLVSPELTVKKTDSGEETVEIVFEEAQKIGEEYLLEATVEDDQGNSMSFIINFYGFNPYVPEVVINEFTCQGSSSHPDLVELYVKTDGNMAGLTMYEGTAGEWDDRLVFPGMPVSAGDYILVHFKPEGIEEEKNEIADKTVSGGLDASDDAYDFWVEGGAGLSGNNGVLTLYTTPRGEIIDGVLYSNRTSSSDENYRGFGTKKVMLWADRLAEDGGWKYDGDLIAPEDGLNPDDSTATRSICRDSSSSDTDTAADWHIVPTSTYSFGEINSEEIYEP